MKYDILVQTFTSSQVRKQYLPFLAQKLEKKNQNPFQATIRLKKTHGPLSHWYRKGKTLVVRPLKKKTFFYVCLPLDTKVIFFLLKIYKGIRKIKLAIVSLKK